MPKCRFCGKSGPFLKLNRLGICDNCNRLANEGMQLRRKKMLEEDIPSAKAYLVTKKTTLQKYLMILLKAGNM